MATKSKSPPAVPPESPHAPQGDRAKPPPHGTPRPAAEGDVPRTVDPLERAPAGLRRFKVRGESPAFLMPPPVKYVLAADEASARRHYLESLGEEYATHRAALESGDNARLVVKALAD